MAKEYDEAEYQPFFHPMTDTNTAILAKLSYLEKRIEKIEAYIHPCVKDGFDICPNQAQDTLFPDAVKLIEGQETASASLFQRRMQVGYARAARILDELHDAGYVGPPIGAHPRKVLQRST